MTMQIRIAKPCDLKQIVAIYNQAITEGNCTADTETLTVEDRQEWFNNHGPEKYPIYIVEDESDNTLMGWCSLSAHRKGRMALQNVAEISYYVDKDRRGMGVGKLLMTHALQKAPTLGLHNLFAILLDTNLVSVAILKKYGFSQWGHLPNIAEFDDKICGQYIYGRKI